MPNAVLNPGQAQLVPSSLGSTTYHAVSHVKKLRQESTRDVLAYLASKVVGLGFRISYPATAGQEGGQCGGVCCNFRSAQLSWTGPKGHVENPT